MRGAKAFQVSMLVSSDLDHRVPETHPLRSIKELSDKILRDMSRRLGAMYSKRGGPSIPPERLLKATLLMALFTIRSERQLCEQLQYNLLYRWFLDMELDGSPFDSSVFAKNRNRLLEHDVAKEFFARVVLAAEEAHLMSDEHFSVDGTLIQAWGSLKSFRPKDDNDVDNNGFGDFKATKRKNDTHESKTDPDAKLMRKGLGKEAKMCHQGHALMENRSGLLKDLEISEANGHAERDVAMEMVKKHLEPGDTLGADAGYNTKDFVKQCRAHGVTPHVAGKAKGSAIDGRTTRHKSYAASQKVRKRIEQIMGWLKNFGGLRKSRYRGRARTRLYAHMAGAAYNLVRMTKLMAAAA